MLRTENWLRLIAAVTFLALGAYAAAFILQKSEGSPLTERAVSDSVSEGFSVRGRAYREFVPVEYDGGEYILLADEGDYLSGGSPVAVKRDSANAYFAASDYELSRRKFSSEEDAISAIQSGDAALRAWAVTYLEGRDKPEKADMPEGVIYAPCAGIFTRLGSEIGSIACGTIWYFSFESEKTVLLYKGQKVNLEISSRPETEAEVFGIDKENGSAVLAVRCCADFIPRDIEYKAKISLSGCTGIRVSASSVRFDDDGNAFVYVLSAGEKEKIPVEIIYTSRDFYLCERGSLREGMEIFVSENSKAG